MAADAQPELFQSSLLLAYNKSNTNYGQFNNSDDDKKPLADGHF
jgi:hypothetical protein